MTPNDDMRLHLKYKQCRLDQTASAEASFSESAVYWNIVQHHKVGLSNLLFEL